jgi:hypothetical protein
MATLFDIPHYRREVKQARRLRYRVRVRLKSNRRIGSAGIYIQRDIYAAGDNGHRSYTRPGTDVNGPRLWPRGGSDVPQARHCFFRNDGWRRRFLDFESDGFRDDSPTPGSHYAGARAYANNLDAVRTAPTFAEAHLTVCLPSGDR